MATDDGSARDRRVEELVGVYDADGSVWGELSYWVGARLGRRHCALCDITHGTFRERQDWIRCRGELRVPFTSHHRDDQPADVRAAAGGRAPVVVARTGDDLHFLLGADEIGRCDGSPEALVDALERAATSAGLAWT